MFIFVYSEWKCVENYNKKNTINLFLKLQSNHKSFRVLFDKIASVYFTWNYIYILALEIASPGNQHRASCIGTLLFPITTDRYSSIIRRSRLVYLAPRHAVSAAFTASRHPSENSMTNRPSSTRRQCQWIEDSRGLPALPATQQSTHWRCSNH